jgi:citrate synthase
MEPTVQDGLEGVVVARTALSHVDGERGQLVVAGDNLEDVAGKETFAGLAARLWSRAGLACTAAQVETALAQGRQTAFERLQRDACRARDGMDALRGAVSRLELDDTVPPLAQAGLVCGATAVHLAAWLAVGQGRAPQRPNPHNTHAQDVLAMVRGSGEIPPAHTAALETYLVTVMDHGLNASTFAARVVASTGSDLVSAVVAALGALKGPLHGGAPGPVLDMLDAIGEPQAAQAWLVAQVEGGQRIMGMGHRIYRVRDPRAAVLERCVEDLRANGATSARLDLARAVERVAVEVLAQRYPARSLAANVEFYTAVLLDALGVDRRAFAPMFAVGRVAGWCAHVMEQRATGRLIRPSSVYASALPPPPPA